MVIKLSRKSIHNCHNEIEKALNPIFFATDEALSSILERDDIFVYEVPTTNREDPGVAVTPIYLREKKSSQSYSPSNLFGQPLLLGIPRYKLHTIFFCCYIPILFLNIRSDHHI